jgi:cation:H+ antiporter
MNTVLAILLLLIGFVLLIKGADVMVEGASSLAKRLGVSTLVIGLTVVAFGTSAPELVVSLISSVQGSGDITIGNLLGSSIANILLILGVSAAIYPLAVKRGTVWKEIPLALLAAVMVAVMASDGLIDGRGFSEISRIDGLVLLAFFVIFLYYTYGLAKAKPSGQVHTKVANRTLSRSILMVVVGSGGLVLGGKWAVDGAVALARLLGASDALIGLTVVAIGTSLPELATSAVAALKKDVDIAVGNVIGSNIFNLFWVMGISGTISALPFSSNLFIDALMTIGVSVMVFALMFIGKRHVLERRQGVLFLMLYVAYIGYLVIRG